MTGLPTRWRAGLLLFAVISALLIVGSASGRLPIPMTEVLGFITGAACVLLVVVQSIWNFPVGIANFGFFIVLFWQSRLFGDMALQVVYLILAILGWYQWLHGGTHRSRLTVRTTSLGEAFALAAVGIALTAVLSVYLRSIHDTAPFLDALTTTASLIAQWMLNTKRLENWFVWIAADVIYVYLYTVKGLHLTAVLYAIFIAMCVAGLISWRRSMEYVPAAGADVQSVEASP